ncbi:hypothetical protein BX666DRAFT_1961896 [Dichotomocladium elegans]|nr:hypothetical protein BX666DRAFT_1961896 [Dichotomocladium elegans]
MPPAVLCRMFSSSQNRKNAKTLYYPFILFFFYCYFTRALTIMTIAMAAQIPKTFANNFWGEDDAGYEVLMHKMTLAKKTCDDLKNFYSTKASLHEELGKKLTKQTKIELGREELGTLGSLLVSVQKQTEASAQAHHELARKIRVELELPLDNFILEQKDKRKLFQTNVDKAHRNKQLHASHVNKTKEKYEAECAKTLSLENQLASAVSQKDIDRLRSKLDRSQNEANTLDKEYRDACTKLAEATGSWNYEWKTACDRFQEMEEKRIEFLHHSMCIYVNILSTTSGQEQESYEHFWTSLDECDPTTDIGLFIDQKGTGNQIPEPAIYVNYFDDPQKTLPRFKTAQFLPGENQESFKYKSSAAPLTSKARRSMSFCEPKRRQSQRASAVSAKDLPQTVEERKIHLYHSSSSVRGEYKKPAPASNKGVSHHISGLYNSNDEYIDPRAQVVVAIGNNQFNVDQNMPEQQQARRKPSRRRTVRNITSIEMEEAFNDSFRGLLQELGVHRTKKSEQAASGPQQEPEQPEVIWARALYDYHSDQPDDLNFRRGSWLAIVRNDHKDWWLAHKWDDTIGSLEETCGYVPSSFVQIVS